jgi:hypothetical protein
VARLLRFLRLEPRKVRNDVEAPAVDPEIERLRSERKQRFASGMEIAEDAPDAQPFLRCAICEADNSRFGEKCMNCGAPLNTAEQRDYNDALWAERRSAEQAKARPPPVGPAGNRALGEELARAVADREQERLSWMAGARNPSAGIRILAALPPQLRTAAILGGLAEVAGTGIAAYHAHDTAWRFVFFASVALVGALFVPRRR